MFTFLETTVSNLLKSVLPEKTAQAANCSGWLYAGCCSGNKTKYVKYCDYGGGITQVGTKCEGNNCVI